MPLTDRERDQLMQALASATSLTLEGRSAGSYIEVKSAIRLVGQWAEHPVTNVVESGEGTLTITYVVPSKPPNEAP